MKTNETNEVAGCEVMVDRSGVGSCWVAVDRDDLPTSVVEEIEGEILDGGVESCDCYVASNGLHYRW